MNRRPPICLPLAAIATALVSVGCEARQNQALAKLERLEIENEELKAQIVKLESTQPAPGQTRAKAEVASTPKTGFSQPEPLSEATLSRSFDTAIDEIKAEWNQAFGTQFEDLRYAKSQTISMPLEIAWPYVRKVGVMFTRDGQTYQKVFDARASWEGTWKFPENNEILTALTALASGAADVVAQADPNVAQPPAGGGVSATQAEPPKSKEKMTALDNIVSEVKEVDWNQARPISEISPGSGK